MATSIVASRSTRYYVYILFSLKDNGLYIGFTADLKNRLSLHSYGKVFATKDRIPLKLIQYEYFINKADAKPEKNFSKAVTDENN